MDINAIEINVTEVRDILSEILELPVDRIHYNPVQKHAVLDLKRNRHVSVCTHQLEEIKRAFNCEDVIISSPYRCILQLKFWTHEDENCCCKRCSKHG